MNTRITFQLNDKVSHGGVWLDFFFPPYVYLNIRECSVLTWKCTHLVEFPIIQLECMPVLPVPLKPRCSLQSMPSWIWQNELSNQTSQLNQMTTLEKQMQIIWKSPKHWGRNPRIDLSVLFQKPDIQWLNLFLQITIYLVDLTLSKWTKKILKSIT